MTKTDTQSFTDELAMACGGELNAACLAVRIAAFIKGSETGTSVTLTIKRVCDIYGWSEYKLKKYVGVLQAAKILDVKYGVWKGAATIWTKGQNFDTFFGSKGQNFSPFNDSQRGKNFSAKGQNFCPNNYTINKQLNNNKYINNIKDFACGDEIPLNTFFKLCGTTDVNEASERGCGNWQQLPHDKDRGIWYKKIGG